AGMRRGSHLSGPPRTAVTDIAVASAEEIGLAQDTRLAGFAPCPIVPNSEYRDVFSRSGRSQLFQPAGRTTFDISVFRNITCAKSRQGRPRYVFTSGDSPVILLCENTNPYGCSAGVDAAVIYPLRQEWI